VDLKNDTASQTIATSPDRVGYTVTYLPLSPTQQTTYKGRMQSHPTCACHIQTIQQIFKLHNVTLVSASKSARALRQILLVCMTSMHFEHLRPLFPWDWDTMLRLRPT